MVGKQTTNMPTVVRLKVDPAFKLQMQMKQGKKPTLRRILKTSRRIEERKPRVIAMNKFLNYAKQVTNKCPSSLIKSEDMCSDKLCDNKSLEMQIAHPNEPKEKYLWWKKLQTNALPVHRQEVTRMGRRAKDRKNRQIKLMLLAPMNNEGCRHAAQSKFDFYMGKCEPTSTRKQKKDYFEMSKFICKA